MGKSVICGVMLLGRAAVFAVGLAVMLVALFAAANAVLGGGPLLPADAGRTAAGTGSAAVDPSLAAESVAQRRQIEYPRGYAQVNVTSTTVSLTGSKGVNGVQRSTTNSSVYCFDLTFVPRTAVASAHINNNATVGTGLGDSVPSNCPTGFKDAAARTYAANTSAETSEVNFRIVFI